MSELGLFEWMTDPVLYLVRVRYPTYTAEFQQFSQEHAKRLACNITDDAPVDLINAKFKMYLRQMWVGDDALSRTIADLAANFSNLDPVNRRREIWRRFLLDVDAYRRELAELSSDDLDKRIWLAMDDHNTLAMGDRNTDEHDYFNEISDDDTEFVTEVVAAKAADYERWLRKPILHKQEIVFLSLGFIPPESNLDNLKLSRQDLSAALKARRDLVGRSIQATTLTEPITPAGFAKWLTLDVVEAPPALVNAASVIAGLDSVEKLATLIAKYRDQPETARFKESYHKLLIGMAVSKYNYRYLTKSSASINISKDIESKSGITLGDDTIRKILAVAAGSIEYPSVFPGSPENPLKDDDQKTPSKRAR